MNRHEVLVELGYLEGYITSDKFVVVGDAARCIRGLTERTDLIQIDLMNPNDLDKLSEVNPELVPVTDDTGIRTVNLGTVAVRDISDCKPGCTYDKPKNTRYNCQRFDILSTEKLNLGYPYKPYTSVIGTFNSSGEYRRKVSGWVKKHLDLNYNTQSFVDMFISYMNKSSFNDHRDYWRVIDWLNSHIAKLRYIPDFSGLSFGLVVEARVGRFSIQVPYALSTDPERAMVYWPYKLDKFNQMDIIQKLDYVESLCSFIPFRIFQEDLSDSNSHLWSHFKKDDYTMRILKRYLDSLEHQPSDDVYYFIKHSMKHGYYLQRDLELSPKKAKK